MAIIHFTAADALQTKVVPADIYTSEVSQITGPSKSASGKSTSMFVDITITEGQFKGKTRTICFNSGTNAVQLLGDMQFYPQAQMLALDAAINGREVTADDYAMDTETLLHKNFDAEWGVATIEGRLINVINGFHPVGYKANGPNF